MFNVKSAIKITDTYGIKFTHKTNLTDIENNTQNNILLNNIVGSLSDILNRFNNKTSLFHLIDNGSYVNEKFHLGLKPNEFVVVDVYGNIYTIKPYCGDEYIVKKAEPFDVQKDYDSDYVRMKVTLFRRIVTVSRLVACCFPEFCGRDITGKYDAHHINMDSTNNDVSNIVFLDKKTHKRLHKAFNRMTEEEKQEAIDALITESGDYDYRLRKINSIIRTYECKKGDK